MFVEQIAPRTEVNLRQVVVSRTVAENWSRFSSCWAIRRGHDPAVSRLQAESGKPGERSFQAEEGSAGAGPEVWLQWGKRTRR